MINAHSSLVCSSILGMVNAHASQVMYSVASEATCQDLLGDRLASQAVTAMKTVSGAAILAQKVPDASGVERPWWSIVGGGSTNSSLVSIDLDAV